MKMNTLLLFSLMTIAAPALAAPAGDGVPWMGVFWQVFNLSILLSALTYFLKDIVRDYFRERRATFVATAEKSQAARASAEKEYKELQAKITDLDRTRNESLVRAEAEAADLRKQMIANAEELAARIRKEAEMTAKVETSRARRELQEQFTRDAVIAARMVLEKDISSQDQERLQGNFVQNMEGVRA